MKKWIVSFLIYSLSFFGFSQIDIRPSISLSNTGSFYVLGGVSNTEYIYRSFTGFNVKLGVDVSMNKGNLYVFGNYQYSGSFPPDGFFDYLFDGNLFKYHSHFVGGEVKYLFFNSKKRFRPYISIMAISEVSTNSKHAYLSDGFGFVSSPQSYVYPSGSSLETLYLSNFYHSTPFVGSFILGCDFRIIEGLHLELGVGYGLRIMKTKYVEWKKGEDVYEKLKTIPNKNHYFNMLDAQLGLSYTFSFKKSKKDE